MVKKVVAIGACPGVEEILDMKGYSVEHVEQKNVLDVLRKEGIEAVIVDLDNTARANVVISGIRHLYPGLWVAAISDDGDNKQISQTLRAEGYNKNFSVILVNIEGFNNLRKKLEKNELLEFLKELIKNMMKALRDCDVIGMVEDKKLVVILPETDYFGSCVSVRKLKKAIEHITTKGEPYASVIFSNVTYPRDGKGYGELLGAAENRIKEQREGTWLKLGFEDKPFWEAISVLLEGKGYEEKDIASFDLGQGLDLPVFFVDRLQELVLQEISQDPRKKGVLYIGIRKISQNLPLLKD